MRNTVGLTCLFYLVSMTVNAEILQIVGTAYQPDGHEILYQENYRVKLDGDDKPLQSQVDYLTAQGEVFAVKRMDYRHHAQAPDIEFIDKRSNTAINVVVEQQSIRITRNENNGKDELTRIDYKNDEAIVIDAGFNQFVLQSWQAIVDGKTIEFGFLPIDRASLVDFSLRLLEQTEQQVVLSLEPLSFWVGLVVDPIELTYDKSTRRLVRYQGLTNLQRAENGQLRDGNYVARIEYEYRPQ